jgi:hypothetical protein
MVAISDVTFLARSGKFLKGIAGGSLTGIVAALANGLYKAGDIDIDAKKSTSSTVTVRNSTAGQAADLLVDGNIVSDAAIRGDAIISDNTIIVAGGTSYGVSIGATPTADRAVTLPDVAGGILVRAASTIVDLLGDTRFDAPGAADTSVGFFNSTLGKVCNVVAEGTIQFLSDIGGTASYSFAGTPTANRVITLPDSDLTLGASIYIGTATKAALLALPPSATPQTAFCSDIAGINGGVTGVQVYWSPASVAWLRYSNDSPI